VDVTLPCDWVSLEDPPPLLTLIATGLFLAMSLLAPAVVEAARRGCTTIWRSFAGTRPAHANQSRAQAEPSARSLGIRSFPDRDE
jgi:hypothetical protein